MTCRYNELISCPANDVLQMCHTTFINTLLFHEMLFLLLLHSCSPWSYIKTVPGKKYKGAPGDFAPEMQTRALKNKQEPLKIARDCNVQCCIFSQWDVKSMWTVLQWNLDIKRLGIRKPSYNKVILLVLALYISLSLCFFNNNTTRNLI